MVVKTKEKISQQDKIAEIELTDKIADGYLQYEESEQYQSVRKRQFELLGLMSLQNKLILDAGCGTGLNGLILSEQGNRVVGVDIANKAIKIAKERADREGALLYPIIGDMERLPFQNASFDVCFCGWVLHHFPDLPHVIGELRRVVKPGGKIALVEPNGSSLAVRGSKFVEDIARRWLVRTGVDTPNENTYTHEQYIEVLEKYGFSDFKVSSWYFGGLSPMPGKSQKSFLGNLSLVLLRIIAYLRRLYFIAIIKLLPSPLNGVDLAITATRI